MNPPPRVFMSYSHDSEPHMERVLALANRLRHDGVDAMIDRYEQSPPGGWVHWMTDQVEMADFVLMICTETYHRRLMKKEVPGLGLGGIWEGHLIANAFYRAGTLSNRFIPVIFDPADATHIPLAFAAAQRYLMSDWSDYPNLFGRLTGQPDMERPPLGPGAGHIPAGRGIEVPIRRAQWTVRPAILLSGVPSKPALFVGRSGAVAAFKRLLRVLPSEESGPLPPRAAAITGWPGVGKSTFVTELPHDPEIQASYPDGILWVALGQAGPDDLQSRIVGTLTDWDSDSPGGVATLPELIRRLRDHLRQRRVLIVADDTWESGLASSFLRLPDEGSTVVFTSRSEDVARHLVPVATDRYRLEELTSEDAVELLFQSGARSLGASGGGG
jgi:hypothetical protein